MQRIQPGKQDEQKNNPDEDSTSTSWRASWPGLGRRLLIGTVLTERRSVASLKRSSRAANARLIASRRELARRALVYINQVNSYHQACNRCLFHND